MVTLQYMQPCCKTALNSTLVCCRLLPFNAEKAVVPDVILLSKLGSPGCCVDVPSCNSNPENDKWQKYAQYAYYRNWILKSTQCTLTAVHISVIIMTQPLVWLEHGNYLLTLGTTQNKYLEGR